MTLGDLMTEKRPSVLLAGESWITESKHIKGVDEFILHSYTEGVQWLRQSIDALDWEFTHLPNHLASERFPVDIDGLMTHDVLILSDIGANTLLLHPATTARSEPTPNRLDLIRKYVELGGGLIMIGGYLSYQGIDGKARYHDTPIEDALPVLMSDVDDRVEVPQGFRPEVHPASGQHCIVDGLPPEFPTMLFYNRFAAKPGSNVLLRNGGDPILVVGTYGEGRAVAFAPDAAPHGATPEFLEWEFFDTFWQRVVRWVAGRIE
jgi:uncharacterized membrane protein